MLVTDGDEEGDEEAVDSEEVESGKEEKENKNTFKLESRLGRRKPSLPIEEWKENSLREGDEKIPRHKMHPDCGGLKFRLRLKYETRQ